MKRAKKTAKRFWDFCCKYLLHCSCRKKTELSVNEALTVQTVRYLGEPTVTELASFFGISQPNATYRVKQLIRKGYLKQSVSEDKRECRLCTADDPAALREQNGFAPGNILDRLSLYFSEEELETAFRVLDKAWNILEQEESDA